MNYMPKKMHLIQFRIYSVFILLSVGHEWSAVPNSACLRRGPRGCLAVNGALVESLWQHHAWTVPLHPPTSAKHRAGQAASTVFQVFSTSSLPGFRSRWAKNHKGVTYFKWGAGTTGSPDGDGHASIWTDRGWNPACKLCWRVHAIKGGSRGTVCDKCSCPKRLWRPTE